TLAQHILAVDDATLGLGGAGASGPDAQAGQETLGDQFVYHFRLAGLAFAKFQQREAATQLTQPPALLTVLLDRRIGDAGTQWRGAGGKLLCVSRIQGAVRVGAGQGQAAAIDQYTGKGVATRQNQGRITEQTADFAFRCNEIG